MSNPDPAMVRSNFDRHPNDTYWTEHWCTRGLLRALERESIEITMAYEPACGRGDIVRILRSDGHMDVLASDVDLTHYREGVAIQRDFLQATCLPLEMHDVPIDQRAIITNPPYYKIDKQYMTDLFVKHALTLEVGVVAMLMRSDWKAAGGRTHFFEQAVLDMGFHMDVQLTSRPRWDDWENIPKPKNGPRHNYSWFVWKRGTARSTTLWEGKS